MGAIPQVRVGAACWRTRLLPWAVALEGNWLFCCIRSLGTAPKSNPQQSGWAESHPMCQEYLLAGRAAMPRIWSLVSHPNSKCPVSLPRGWFGRGPRALRASREGARPADVSLCCAVGVGAKEGKGSLLRFLCAVAQKQDPMTLKIHLPNYSISIFSYT